MGNGVQNEFIPETLPPPGETLLETMDAVGMSQVELARRIGMAVPTINRMIKGLEPITPKTALQLERALGVPAGFWNRLERNYREVEARRKESESLATQVHWLKTMPVRAMIRAGFVEESKNKVEQARALLQFFGVASPQQWHAVYDSKDACFRQSSLYPSHPAATAAWLRQGELEAQAIECAPFERRGFLEALAAIRGLTCEGPEALRSQLRVHCAAVGVAVVLVPPLEGTSICGATRWLTPEKALIQLSLRGRWEDSRWFSFFHEAGHLLKHGKNGTFLECDEQNNDVREVEADRFAADTLISPRDYRRFLEARRFTRNAIEQFATELGISPAIVVGRLKHDNQLKQNQLNGLRRKCEIHGR